MGDGLRTAGRRVAMFIAAVGVTVSVVPAHLDAASDGNPIMSAKFRVPQLARSVVIRRRLLNDSRRGFRARSRW
jgi:hypothetical protein